MVAAGALIAIVLGASAGASDWCSQTEKALSRSLEDTQVEMEPESTLRDVFSRATAASAKCPQAEGVAYLRLRSAELGGGMLIGELPIGTLDELKGLTAEAAQRFPQSARILTVRARATRDAAIARRAIAIDSSYGPARVVLADILVDAGNWTDAEKVLGQVRNLGVISDGFTVLARIDLAKGDAHAALAAVRRALTGRSPDLVEPDAGDPRPVRRAHAVAAMAAIALGRFQQAATHLSAADPQDPVIREVLHNPPKGLARALRARARSAN